MSKSNWNKMSGWYDNMVGSKGHRYHQEYAIPTVMRLLNTKKGEHILDVGCGQGALAPHINKTGARYTGIDSSENLIRLARRRHKKKGHFYIANAAELSKSKDLTGKSFNAAVFMLSIQDMDPLNTIMKEAVSMLKKNGKIVFFMMHPSFRIPRQSGWGEDKKRKLVYRRVDRYLTSETIPLNTNIREKGKRITSYFYHRPLTEYFKEFSKNGLVLDKLIEVAEKKKGYDEFPTFLAMRLINN